MGQIGHSIRTNQRLMGLLISLVPLCYIGAGYAFAVIKMAICALLAISLLIERKLYNRLRPSLWLFVITIFTIILFMFRNNKPSILPTLIFIIEFLAIFLNKKYVMEQKVYYSDRFVIGCGVAGVIGFLYMWRTGTFVTGGAYTENALNISNITVPLYLALFIIYLVFRQISRKKISLLNIITILALFEAMVFLGKRGPILFVFLAVLCAFYIKRNNIRTIILIVVFAFPIYEIPITTLISQHVDFFSQFSERMNDFEDIEDNPRVIRVLAGIQFLEDFEPADLFGYHEEIQLTKNADDEVHNHFHNFLLQLYYETGLISMLSIFVITILLYGCNKARGVNINTKVSFAYILFLYMIGTNESLLKIGSSMEIATFFFITYIYSYEYSKQ